MPALPRDRGLPATLVTPPAAHASAEARTRRLARPLYLILAGLICGILLASALPLPPVLLFVAAAALLAIAIVFSPKEGQTYLSVLLLIAPFVALGAGLARQASLPLASDVVLLAADGPSVWVEGTVASDPEVHPSGALSFVLAARRVDDFESVRSASGRVQVIVAKPAEDVPAPLPGDTLWLRGRVERLAGVTNPNGFDERSFLARRGIQSTMVVRHGSDIRLSSPSSGGWSVARLATAARERILRTIESQLGSADASVLGSILLSEHARLNADTKNAYERTGALHILSVSGLHLAALAAALTWLFGTVCGVPRRIANPIVIAILWMLALASGGGFAATRAAIVFTIVLMAPVLRRAAADPIHSLAVAAFVLLVASPLSLYDAGIQLSFATIAILVLWLPVIETMYLPWEPGQSRLSNAARHILVALAAGLIAQIGSWPLVAYYFNIVSTVAPFVSLLVAPIAVALLLGGLLTSLLAQILPAPVLLPFWTALHVLLTLLHAFTNLFSALPFAAFSILSPPAFLIVIYYALLGGGAVVVRKSILQKQNVRRGGHSGGATAAGLGGVSPTP